MREINKIILHHTASCQLSCIEYYPILYNYHVNVRGYKDIGYHFIIDKFGNVKKCRDITEVGAHCYGHNKDSIGIALIGNYSKIQPSKEMRSALWNLICDLDYKYNNGQIFQVYNHSDFARTLCPGINASSLKYEINRYCNYV